VLEKANDVIKMAWKFLLAMGRHWWAKRRGYEIFTPKSALAFRDHECAICDFNEDGQCGVCKCLTISKTLLALEECPMGKWHRVWVKRKSKTNP
jgi:hypothetical protein